MLLNPIIENQKLETLDPKSVDFYVDGSAGKEHKREGFVLKSPSGMECAYARKFDFTVSNNGSEYEALLARLCMVLATNIDRFITSEDSQVVYNHVTGSFEANEDNIKTYSALANASASLFSTDMV